MNTFVFFTARRKALILTFVISLLFVAVPLGLVLYFFPFELREDNGPPFAALLILGLILIFAGAVMRYKK